MTTTTLDLPLLRPPPPIPGPHRRRAVITDHPVPALHSPLGDPMEKDVRVHESLWGLRAFRPTRYRRDLRHDPTVGSPVRLLYPGRRGRLHVPSATAGRHRSSPGGVGHVGLHTESGSGREPRVSDRPLRVGLAPYRPRRVPWRGRDRVSETGHATEDRTGNGPSNTPTVHEESTNHLPAQRRRAGLLRGRDGTCGDAPKKAEEPDDRGGARSRVYREGGVREPEVTSAGSHR